MTKTVKNLLLSGGLIIAASSAYAANSNYYYDYKPSVEVNLSVLDDINEQNVTSNKLSPAFEEKIVPVTKKIEKPVKITKKTEEIQEKITPVKTEPAETKENDIVKPLTDNDNIQATSAAPVSEEKEALGSFVTGTDSSIKKIGLPNSIAPAQKSIEPANPISNSTTANIKQSDGAPNSAPVTPVNEVSVSDTPKDLTPNNTENESEPQKEETKIASNDDAQNNPEIKQDAISSAPGKLLTLTFAPEDITISENDINTIKEIAAKEKDHNEVNFRLLSYASDIDEKKKRARRISLSRALAVRNILKDNGIKGSRIELRALGDKNEDANAPLDRLDIFTYIRN